MEVVHGTYKASKFVTEEDDNDVISRMPDNVITNILDCLPIQDAVRTGILSRNWKFKWTLLTQLVFDDDFFEYLEETGGEKGFDGRIIINRLLLHFKGSIKKFVLYIPQDNDDDNDTVRFDDEDINHWVMFLSEKGIEEFTLLNRHETPLNLHAHLFSCLKLKHLDLYKCCFPAIHSFRGFPNLLSLDLFEVTFKSNNCGEFLICCPLLEILKIQFTSTCEMKRVEIPKLENLEVLSLPICELGNMARITSSSIFQLIGYSSKLKELKLDFLNCKLFEDTKRRAPTILPCLKTLSLYNIDFRNDAMVSCVIELICGSSNMKFLVITGAYDDIVPPLAVGSSNVEVDYKTGHLELQLGEVRILRITGLENEVCLIKFLLASSPLLKNMVINVNSSMVFGGGHPGEMMFATKLLKFHRASTVAEIDLRWF